MTGRVSGVAARLKSRQTNLTTIHCVAHRLALAAGQAGEKVPYLCTTFKPTLRQLFNFYQNSSVRMSGLKAIEQVLQLPELKLKKAADTRWLSHDNACKTLVRVLPAVIASLEREVIERGDALAVGLSRVVKHYNFVASLYMMCDVLPKVSRLSRIFQFSTIDMSALHMCVTTTVDALKLLLHTDGEYMTKFGSDLTTSLASSGITHGGDGAKQTFHTQIVKRLIEALISNIKEQLPDTGIFSDFDVLNPLKFPATTEEAAETHYGEPSVQKLGDHYCVGDATIISSDELSSEWLDLRVYLILNCSNFCMKDVLCLLAKKETTISSVYPNFSKLSQIFLTLPISTADCERAFSTRIKTRLRNQMTNDTLNHCMRVSMEGQPLTEFDFEKSVTSWSSLKNRRIIKMGGFWVWSLGRGLKCRSVTFFWGKPWSFSQ